jgi:hypothetical protein
VRRLICVLLFSIFIAAAGLEVIIRLFDPLGVSHFSDMPRYFSKLCEVVGPPRILKHRSNKSIKFRDFTISTNRLGLRGPELPETKSSAEFRLVFLGDSVVLGWGVDLEEHFLTLAESELNELGKNKTTHRCVNTGHNQFDTTQEAALLEELGEVLSPDAVILVYVNNDVNPTIKTYEALLKQASEGKDQPAGWLKKTRVTVVNALRRVFKGLSNMRSLLSHLLSMKEKVEEIEEKNGQVDDEGWIASRDALCKIRDWCSARKIPFLVLNHTKPAIGSHPAEIPPLIPFLEKEKIPCFPFFFTPEELEEPIRHSFSDAHANALGHQLLLKKLRPALRSVGLKTR